MRHTPLSVRARHSAAFSLLEMMIAVAVFVIISAVAFTLLSLSQRRYQTESQVLNSFQEARLGLDQIVRDVNDSGYPPPSQYQFGVTPPSASLYSSSPFAWAPNYPNNPCAIAITPCTTPSDTDLIVETLADAVTCGGGVSWIRYQLNAAQSTLFRGIVCKVAGDDPSVDTVAAGVMVPYVQNVMNSASAAQIAQFQAVYPALFPGGNPVPIFTYTCDTPAGPQSCAAASASDNSPVNIREVNITLIVMAPTPDQQTGLPRLVSLNGRGRRVNPNANE